MSKSMPPLLAEVREDGTVEAWGAASSIPAPRESVAPLLPLNIERDMWQSFAHVRQRRAIRTAKILLGLVSNNPDLRDSASPDYLLLMILEIYCQCAVHGILVPAITH